MTNRSITETIAGWLIHHRKVGLPAGVLEKTREYVLDWLGSALAGTASEPGRALEAYARSQPVGPCTVVGSQIGRSAEVAALANGGLSHIVEMDDVDRRSVLHPGAAVIPAALAVAERVGARGRELLSAVAAGYEVAIRIGEAVGNEHYYYFHNTATCGVFGSAAAAAWLLQLDSDAIVWALGNAGTQAAGLWEFNSDGAMSKHLHTGRAAAGGVLAADLAALGFTGARRILEGRRGFFAAMAPAGKPELILDGLVETPARFKVFNVSIKPHPSCRHTHAAIDATLGLLSPAVRGGIERVEIETYEAALALCDNPSPKTPYEAKFSLQYCVASALSRGHVGLGDFAEEAIADPEIRELLPAIALSSNPQFEEHYPTQWPVRVRIRLKTGETLSASVRHPKGDPEQPLSARELEAKFRELAAYGGHEMAADALLDWVARLAEAEAVSYPKTGRFDVAT